MKNSGKNKIEEPYRPEDTLNSPIKDPDLERNENDIPVIEKQKTNPPSANSKKRLR